MRCACTAIGHSSSCSICGHYFSGLLVFRISPSFMTFPHLEFFVFFSYEPRGSLPSPLPPRRKVQNRCRVKPSFATFLSLFGLTLFPSPSPQVPSPYPLSPFYFSLLRMRPFILPPPHVAPVIHPSPIFRDFSRFRNLTTIRRYSFFRRR